MNKKFLLVCALMASASAPAVVRAQVVGPAAPVAAEMTDEQLKALGEGIAFPYEKLDSALEKNVDESGAVFYGKIKGRNDLETFVRAVAIADLTKFPNWTIPSDPEDPRSKLVPDKTPLLAFYINAYNGLFLKAVSDAYPVGSPLEIKNLDTDKTRVVAGQKYSFAELRKKIAEMDGRALFALPDGTNSGPRAANSVFRFTSLSAQLNAAVSSFVNDVSRVAPPVRLQNVVAVSSWMQTVDPYFGAKSTRNKWNGIREVLVRYTKRDSDQRYFAAGDYQVNFMMPDKSINEQLSR